MKPTSAGKGVTATTRGQPAHSVGFNKRLRPQIEFLHRGSMLRNQNRKVQFLRPHSKELCMSTLLTTPLLENNPKKRVPLTFKRFRPSGLKLSTYIAEECSGTNTVYHKVQFLRPLSKELSLPSLLTTHALATHSELGHRPPLINSAGSYGRAKLRKMRPPTLRRPMFNPRPRHKPRPRQPFCTAH